MSSIGSYSFNALDGGTIEMLREMGVEITRRGVNGFADHKIGQRGKPKTFVGHADIADEATVKTTIAGYLALVRTKQTFTDDIGNAYTNIFVHDVEIVGQFKVLTSVGGLCEGDYILISRWTLQATGTTA